MKADTVKQILINTIEKLGHNNYLNELDQDLHFLSSIVQKINSNTIFRKKSFSSVYEFSVYRNFLYNLIRNTKPKIVIETGVLHGLTSSWILKALHDNMQGKLISIDLPRRDWNLYFPDTDFGPGSESELELGNEEPGWIIPESLKNRWEVHYKPSHIALPDILASNIDVDLFIHDSDHSYEVMKFECELIRNKFPGASIIIDDYNLNSYWKEIRDKKSCEIFDVDDENTTVSGFLYLP